MVNDFIKKAAVLLNLHVVFQALQRDFKTSDMRKFVFFGLAGIVYFVFFIALFQVKGDKVNAGCKSEALENPSGRLSWEFNRIKDPATNAIPKGIFARELEFALTLPSDRDEMKRSESWINRGPWHVGGRTRSLAYDVNNENILMAGAVSGGIWRSVNGGQSWTKITPLTGLQSVSCIVQDKRPGKTNTWYYGTGELYGNSASAPYAFYMGNGIYKSSDNGLTWNSLTSTASNTPSSFDIWDGVWNMAVDLSKDTQDVVYAATYGTIFRSENGGTTWKAVLGGISSDYSYFTDVAVTKKGIVYATLSYDGYGRGIWRSADGIQWTEITPGSFPPDYKRIVIGIDPNNENNVYFLAHTPGYGKMSKNYKGTEDWNSLWKFTYISGDSVNLKGNWSNLTDNIPSKGNSSFDDFSAQGSYNLVIAVKPGDSNTIIIGGTNLYRSTDAFRTSGNVVQIGGYEPGTKIPDWHVYPDHHPDQHVICFLSSNPGIMLNGNDGGIFKTGNCMAANVSWQPLNHGYLTTQAYTVNIDRYSDNDILLAGFQDNGNYFTSVPDPLSTWIMPLNGDGSYSGIAADRSYYVFSKQEGKMQKCNLDANGNKTAFARIDPIGGYGYQFINPFIIDPNDDNLLYLAAGRHIFRNDQMRSIPMAGNYDSISYGWTMFTDSIKNIREITAIAVSKNPANRLYFGTNSKDVYRIDQANTGNPPLIKLPTTYLPTGGNISCIAIDPRDADKVILVYSNYNVYSLFYSTDGGNSWQKIAGNLEEKSDGTGNGPSLRWASVLPFGSRTLYLVGSSVGLFATDSLNGVNTIWKQVGSQTIGNAVVDMIVTRETDATIAIATHGSGIFTTKITSLDDFLGIAETKQADKNDYRVFPNPAAGFVNIEQSQNLKRAFTVQIYNLSGTQVGFFNSSYKNLKLDISGYTPGIYQLYIQSGNKKEYRKLLITR